MILKNVSERSGHVPSWNVSKMFRAFSEVGLKRIVMTASLLSLTACGDYEAGKASVAPSSDLALKKGVIFKHSTHTVNPCTSCHPTGSTVKITGFGKDWAHKKCKDCHVNAKKGPTSCKGCHTN